MKVTVGTIVCLLIALASAPASAHHAFAVEFDAKNCSDITGVLTKVSYENPHAYIYVDAKEGGSGPVVTKTFSVPRSGDSDENVHRRDAGSGPHAAGGRRAGEETLRRGQRQRQAGAAAAGRTRAADVRRPRRSVGQ